MENLSEDVKDLKSLLEEKKVGEVVTCAITPNIRTLELEVEIKGFVNNAVSTMEIGRLVDNYQREKLNNRFPRILKCRVDSGIFHLILVP